VQWNSISEQFITILHLSLKKITSRQLVGLIALHQLGWLVCNIKYGPLHNLRASIRLVAENPSIFCAFLEVAENGSHYMIA